MTASTREAEAELSPAQELEIERLLRADAAREPYIEDDGFTARVLTALPPPAPRRSYSWLGPALGAVGAAGFAAFSQLPAQLAVPLKAVAHGHLPSTQSLLVLLPVALLVGLASWLAATDAA